MKKVLIAGMGNVLRGDDGFGVEIARRRSVPADDRTEESREVAVTSRAS